MGSICKNFDGCSNHSKIRASEIIDSNNFAAKCTLRFPRVEKIRDDKSWESVTTLDQLMSLKKTFNGKSSKQVSEISENPDVPKPKRRRSGQPTLGPQFKSSDLKNIDTKRDVFNGREFCILNALEDDSSYSKQNLEIKVKEFGGSIVQYPGSRTTCAIAERKVLKMKSIALLETVDIVKLQWLINCIEKESYIPWTPSDMWFMTKRTRSSFLQNYDEFGDSYTVETNTCDLKKLFDHINPEGTDKGELDEIQFEYLPDYKYGLFKRLSVYIDRSTFVCEKQIDHLFKMNFIESLIRLHGATILPTLDAFCSHVVYDSEIRDRLHYFEKVNRNRERKFHIVDNIWVTRCVEHGCILSEV